jgi:membrane protein required for colicin V production
MDEVSVTAVDIVVVAIVLLSAVFAMYRGLVSETFNIVDWAAATFIAVEFTPTFQPLLGGSIEPAWLEYIVTFIGIFLVMFIPLSMLNFKVSEAVRKSEIGPVDRVLGFLFGTIRGIAIVGVAYILYAMFVPMEQHPQTLTRSHVYPVIRQSAEMLLDIVPGRQELAGLDSPVGGPQPPSAPPGATPQRADAAAPQGNRAGNAATKGNAAVKGNAAAYGADDQKALDKLIEGAGRNQGSSK